MDSGKVRMAILSNGGSAVCSGIVISTKRVTNRRMCSSSRHQMTTGPGFRQTPHQSVSCGVLPPIVKFSGRLDPRTIDANMDLERGRTMNQVNVSGAETDTVYQCSVSKPEA